MSYSNTRTWKHPRVVEIEARTKLNQRRGRFCPKSPFFTWNFNFAEHLHESSQLLKNNAMRKTNDLSNAAIFHIDQVRADIDFRAGRGDDRPAPRRVSSVGDTA